MKAVEYLKKLIGFSICDIISCAECKEQLGVTECPIDDFQPRVRVDLGKVFAEKLALGPVDLGELEELNVDELLRLVTEITENYVPNEEQPRRTEHVRFDDIEMPF